MATDKTKNREHVIREDLTFWQGITKNIHEGGPFFIMALGAMILIAPQLFEFFIIAVAVVLYVYRTVQYPENPTYYGPVQKGSTPLYCMGLEMSVKQPVWFSDTQMRQHMLVMGTTGAGKAQPLDALVHTPDGWVRMGDLQVGMDVSAPDGKTAKILGIFPQGKVPIYKVEFEDGRTTEACGNHLWEIHHKHWNEKNKKDGARPGKSRPRTLNTLEVKRLLDTTKGKFSVRLTEPVHKKSKPLPLDAYLVGTLLGGGNLSGPKGPTLSFSTGDFEILNRVKGALPPGVELYPYESESKLDYQFITTDNINGKKNALTEILKSVGLLGLDSGNKFIPKEYLESDIDDRWALLQGLMDTEGTFDIRKTSISYITISKSLAAGVQELVRSLGGTAKIKEKPTFFTYNGEKKKGQTAYHLNIRIRNPMDVFYLSKKQKLAEHYQEDNNLKLGIKSIEFVGEKEAQCIYIDHKDHLYITDDYIVTHNTELLLFLSAQAMAMGSGVIFVDGKGDVKTWFRLYSIAKRLGVEENLRVLNFGTNRKHGEIKYDLSNTLNPFTLGDAGQLAEMMSALMAEAGGDGGMWKGRAESMMRALLTALVDLRDIGVLALGPGTLSDFMPLDKFASMENDPRISDLGRLEVKRYLDSLPGYRAGGQGKAEADKQHGFLTMQFTEILGLFNNAYGHIMAFKYGEVDMFDVIVNRRSLYVMLPSMEKSGNSVKNLGKIVVNQVRAALSRTLGAGIKGTKAEKLEARPTASATPMLCILDEYGSYAVEGFGEVAAQARSIGFSTVFAVQDWASLEKADAKGNEAQRIWANTNIKIIMKVEDSKSTMPLVIDRIKEGYVLADQGKEVNEDSMMGGLRYQKNVGYKEIKRLDPLKLFTLKNGRMFVICEDRFHEVQSTYLPDDSGGWANVDFVRPNRLLPLAPPNMEQIASEIAMSRNWVFSGDFNSTEELLDSSIPDEAAFFKAALEAMNLYTDDDPARQGLEFVRVFMRTALQFAAKEAHKLFMGSSSGGSSSGGEDNPYRTSRASANDTTQPNIPWSAPVANERDDADEYDEMIDDDDEYEDSGDPYVIQDYSETEEDIDTYPENQNKAMPVLNSREYISGALELAEDKDDTIKNQIMRKMQGNDDSDGDGDYEDHYDDDEDDTDE